MRAALFVVVSLLYTSVASAQEALSLWEGKPGTKVDKKTLLPLVVPKGSITTPAGKKGKPALLPLVPGFDVALVIAQKEGETVVMHYVRESDVASVKVAFKMAIDNLGTASEKGEYQPSSVSGEDGKPKYMVWTGPFAASFVLLPGVHEMAARNFGAKKIIAAIPNRDTLVLVADIATNTPEHISELLKEASSEGSAIMIETLYRLSPNIQKPFYDQPPLRPLTPG